MTSRRKKKEKEKDRIPLSVHFQKFSDRFSTTPLDPDEEGMPISFRKKSKSSQKGGKNGLGSYGQGEFSLDQLAKKHFLTAAPPTFGRKEVRRPLMKQTPESEKETVVKLSKMILKFMGDQTDYRSKMSHQSHQPNYGAVMKRLYKQFGLGSVTKENENGGTTVTRNGSAHPHIARYQHKAKAGGTIKRLRATISHRLFPESGTVFDMLPIDETLMTPVDQLQYIIGIGILRTILRDEMFCLIMKQIVDNPYKESLSRGWLLLWLMAGCFSPSDTLFPYVLNFVENGPAHYATHLKRLLDRTKLNGTRFQPPSYVELEAALQKKPIELTVTLMDGTMHTVPIDPAFTSKEFCEKLMRLIVLQSTPGFALYMCLNEKIASLGSGSDHVMDSISQCEQLHREWAGEGTEANAPWRLFFRKEIFIPWEDSQDDYVGTNLAFAQVVRGVTLGEYICDTDTELALLAAQQYYIEYGGDISEEALQAVLPSYLPASKREDTSASSDPLKYWRKTVIKIYRKLYDGKEDHLRPDTQRVKLDVVRFAKGKWANKFCRFYEATKLEGPAWDSNNIILGISGETIDVYNPEGTKFLSVTYPEILQVSGEKEFDDAPAHIVIFFLANGRLIKLESVDAGEVIEIVTLILEGLRQRSRWAVVNEDVSGRSAEELTIKEGDLIVLQQRAREGALASSHCHGTNKRTGHQGEVASKALYIVPSLVEPTKKTLALFKNKAKKFTLPTEVFQFGSIATLHASVPNSQYNWRDNAIMDSENDMDKTRAEKRESLSVLADGENPVKPMLNGRYSGSLADSEDTSSQRAPSSVITIDSDSKAEAGRTPSSASSHLLISSSTTSETAPMIRQPASPVSHSPDPTYVSPVSRSPDPTCVSSTKENAAVMSNGHGTAIGNGHPPNFDVFASQDIITAL